MFRDPFHRKTKIFIRASVLGIFCSLIFFNRAQAVDADSDGLEASVDNTDSVALLTPHVIVPSERQGVVNAALQATFSGDAEVGTQIRMFNQALTQLCTDDVDGNGISFGGSSAAVLDSQTLMSGNITAQFFYDTTTDSASTAWRTNADNSWHTGTNFPQKSILIATASQLKIYDANTSTSANTRALWKTYSISDITSLFALNGTVYIGTSSAGVKLYDFASDDLSASLVSPSIASNAVTSLDGKHIGSDDFLVIGAATGISVYDATGETFASKTTTTVDDLAIDSANKLRYSLGLTAYISTLTVDNLAAAWAVTDISALSHFASANDSTLHGNLVGHSQGATIGDVTAGFRRITKDYATYPFLGNEKGFWFDSVTDRSGNGNNLTNNNSVAIAAVASGAETQQFTFNGTSNYLSSADTDFNVTGSGLSVGMWIKRSDTGGSGAYAQILSHGTSRDTRSYFLSAGDEFFDYPLAYDPYFFGVQTSNGFKAASVQTTPTAGSWEFIVGTYDGSNVKIYRNGVLEETNAHTGTIVSVAEDLRLGWGYDSEYFDGIIALPFVSAQALTATQVTAYYNITSGWFAANAAVTLHGASNVVTDLSSQPLRNGAYISTTSGITKLNTSTGLTTEILADQNVQNMAVTHIGTFQCSATLAQGTHTVFAKGFIGANASNIVSGNRVFYLFQATAGDLDGDGLLNDDDNEPNTPIATPTITTVDNTSGYTYQFTGTGDGTTYPAFPTRIAVLEVGNATPLFYANVNGSNAWTATYTFPVGTHTVYARAYVGTNASNKDSDQFVVQVEAPIPTPPTPDTMASFTKGNKVSLSWASNTLNAQYYAEISTSSLFQTVVTNSGWIWETSYNFENLTNETTYYFRVKLRDSGGTETAWSSTATTTMDSTLPTAGSVSNGGNYSASTAVTFSWGSFSDAGAGLSHYEVQIDDASDFASPLFSDTHYTTSSKSYTGTQNTTYYARVRAVDNVANKSVWVQSAGVLVDTSAPSGFTVTTPTSPAPAGDQTIAWSAASDPESGIAQYTIYRADYQSVIRYPDGAGWELDSPSHSIGTTTNLNFVDTTTQASKKYAYTVRAANKAGGTTDSNTIEFEVQPINSAPVWENIDQYVSGDAVTLDWVEAGDVNDLASYEVYRDAVLLYTTPNATTTSYTDSEVKNNGQIYSYKVRGQDAQGNRGSFSSSLLVIVDKTAPTTAQAISGTPNGSGWYNAPVSVTLTGTDAGTSLFNPNSSTGTGFYAGVDQIFYNKNSAGLTPYTSGISFDTTGTNTLSFYATDRAGNMEVTQNIQVKIDTTSPTAGFATNLDLATDNGFVNANSANFTSTGADAHSGLASVVTSVRFDQNGDGTLAGANDFDFTQIATSATSPSTGTYTFTRDGKYDFKVVVTDGVGNVTTSSFTTIKVDRVAPVTADNAPSAVPAVTPFTVTLTPSDSPISSGIAQTYYTTNGTNPTTSSSSGRAVSITAGQVSGGYFTVKYFSVDNLGNSESIKTATNTPTDTDSDGMHDWWEDQYSLNKNSAADASLDGDSDTLTNLQEYTNGTRPADSDTDDDTISDGTEVSDATDPNNRDDHRVIVIAPQATIRTPFVFMGLAPVGRTVSIKNSSGTVLGTAVADANGRFVMELTLAAGSTYTLSAQFLHPDGQFVTTPNISITVSASAASPVFTNLTEGQLFAQGFLTPALTAAASVSMELYQIQNGDISSLSSATSSGAGVVSFDLPNNFLGGQIFALDQANKLTSELLTVERGVNATGQILNQNNSPIEGVIVKFINGPTEYQTATDTSGNYSLTVDGDTTYVVKIYHSYYLKDERTVAVARTDLKISPILILVGSLNQVQTETGLVTIAGSGEAGTLRAEGLSRKEILAAAELGYEYSLKKAQEINLGTEGKVLTRTDEETGREQFLGYQPGRLAVEAIEALPEVARRITGLIGSERRETARGEEGNYLSAAKKEQICLETFDTVADLKDVPASHPYAEDIAQMNAYGVFTSDDKHRFWPENPVTWNEVFTLIFQANCISIKSLSELQSADLPQLPKFPLENTELSLLVYTALHQKIIDGAFDPLISPNRQNVIRLLVVAFQLEINLQAKNSAFDDVLENDPMAPILVATKQAGLFKNFVAERFFYHFKEVTRAEFSTWFVNAVKYREAAISPKNLFEKFMKKLRGEEEEKEQARVGVRQTLKSEVETHLTGRRYSQQKEEDAKKYAAPTRSSWRPWDVTTTRKPIQYMDKSENVRRFQRPEIQRQ